MTTTTDGVYITCPVGYALGKELEDDGALEAFELAEIYEIGFYTALAAAVAAPEWALAQLRRCVEWAEALEQAHAIIREHPIVPEAD